jgi:hypothetical protein
MERRTSPCHIIIKMPRLENKERILTATRLKCQFKCKGKHIRIISDLLSTNTKRQEHMEKLISCPERK